MNIINLKKKLGTESKAWASNISWVLGGKCISMLFFQAFDILIARLLKVEGYSEWAYFFSILSILYLLGWLGINTSSRVIVSKQTDENSRKTCLYSAAAVRIVVSIIACFILYLVSGKMAVVLNSDSKYPNLGILMKIGVGIILFNSFMEFFKEVFNGIQRYRNIFLISVFEYGGYFLFTVVMLWSNRAVSSVASAYLFAGILTTAVGGRLLQAEFMDYKKSKFDRTAAVGYIKEILRYAMPMFVISVGSIILIEMDVFMLGYMSDSHEIAIYNVAKQLCHKATHLNSSLFAGTLVTISIITIDNYKQRRSSFEKIKRMNYVLISAVAVALVIIGHWFVPIIYGREYEEAGKIMYILVLYYVLYGVSTLDSCFLDYQKKAGSRSIWFLSVEVINFVLDYLLIPKYGAMGAAIGTVTALVPYTVYAYVAVRNVFKSTEKLAIQNIR